MKKSFKLTAFTLLFCLAAGTASAENIKDRFGITGLMGFTLPASSSVIGATLDTDPGIIFGGGFLYGIDKNLAAELTVLHSGFDAKDVSTGNKIAEFEVIDISIGGQYRVITSVPSLVPYVGAGLDILLNDFKITSGPVVRGDIDTTIGVHVSGGADYFLNKNLALTGELRIMTAMSGDIRPDVGKGGKFDPSSFSGLFGIRYFLD